MNPTAGQPKAPESKPDTKDDLKSIPMPELEKKLTSSPDGLSQAEAAKRLVITQPRLNDLLRGRIDKFSLDALVDLASRAGLSVHVKISRAA